jgi:hypothetical protein
MKSGTAIQGTKESAAMTESVHTLQIEVWSIDRFVFYARNPRKNDAAVDSVARADWDEVPL